MGTRHLIAVQVDGQYKVAQYGQWDGYPEGQGKSVLGFLRKADLRSFADKCRAASWISKEEHDAAYVACGAASGEAWVTLDVSSKFKEEHPELHRDTGANILALLDKLPAGVKLSDNIEFAGDSLFCEWAYVVDLDAGTFEVYKGFNKEPLAAGERFVSFFQKKERPDAEQYHPVKLAGKWKLDDLPSDEAFLRHFEEADEEESQSA